MPKRFQRSHTVFEGKSAIFRDFPFQTQPLTNEPQSQMFLMEMLLNELILLSYYDNANDLIAFIQLIGP